MSARREDESFHLAPLGPVRFALRLLAMALLLIGYLPLHYLSKLATGRSPWPHRFLVGVVRICGARVYVEGQTLNHNVIFVANHLSWLDIAVVGATTGAAFIANHGVASWPVVGRLAAINGTIFVDRTERLAVSHQIAIIRAALTSGRPVVIFPEGTTSDGGGVLPFKPSLFAALTEPPPGLRVQPMLIDYGEEAADIAWIGQESAARSAYRLLRRNTSLSVRLIFLEPFDPSRAGDRKTIAARARSEIVAAHASSLAARASL